MDNENKFHLIKFYHVIQYLREGKRSNEGFTNQSCYFSSMAKKSILNATKLPNG